jgi:hypothetical protein
MTEAPETKRPVPTITDPVNTMTRPSPVIAAGLMPMTLRVLPIASR